MGICMSCDGAEAGAYQLPTAKLILQDGELLEFPQAVKVTRALLGDSSSCFVCDADGMEFDGFVSAVDELRPGQIYFVLPSSMLRHPLQADDLAALAVKASAALMRAVPLPPKAGSVSSRKRGVAPQPLVFADVVTPKQPESLPLRPMRKRSIGKGRDFSSSLTAISE